MRVHVLVAHSIHHWTLASVWESRLDTVASKMLISRGRMLNFSSNVGQLPKAEARLGPKLPRIRNRTKDTHTYIHTYVHTYLRTCIHTYTNVCVCMYAYIHVHASMCL